ncbi:iron-sulfur cluster repair di-iron protein [Echinicola jeungdonensis]|uniref:Iron-sulfur cluster repair di-iron protein n=1 Tax=Echinicola jeungdonensis TaxID=709343 RepID=A0ABV5J507_9BACT|nr:iron-sulfur cluster repair di-iron protein [Echinicola jeungdonensis]MDN3670682.1 iron-sulfur cluster repair di-iron protein [Echinicola jeungdonensis]
MITKNNHTIGEMVAADYRAATVFESFGIDFCCKGGRTLEEACEKKKIAPEAVKQELEKVFNTGDQENLNVSSWPLDLLADYIEKTHHRYVEERVPLLLQYLSKLCKVHGDAHPELLDVHRLFSESAGELTTHMKKEELILFPYIRKMVKYQKEGKSMDVPHFGSVRNPIFMMMEEHEAEGNRFEKISQLTSGYVPPKDACNTFRVTYALLDEFEKDLHRHIHLENNILFPSVVKAENYSQN